MLQFGDQLVAELQTAGLQSCSALHTAVLRLHTAEPRAGPARWVELLSSQVQSLVPASQLSANFPLPAAVHILVLHSLPALPRSNNTRRITLNKKGS